ncbi:lantibiotic dehydratase C-terminal domain-containing protein [Streptomyces sp. URMC 125]|uniref:lantibiotic dehydratase C-terminal domain-containing protein n=1 Tax=Streptomyces sp. URMC 125 TaxID=3423419 RepID=UPI003F1DA993
MPSGSDPLNPAEADGSDWVCAHIFYDTDQDALLTECARPLVRELTADGLVQRYFFLRYWEGGPHVRLRLLPLRTADRAEVERRAARRIRAFLADTPAADVVDRSRFAQVARGLADLEGRPGHDHVVRPNNSVDFPAYEREHGDYGYGAAIGAVERHFHESSELALSVVAAGTTVEQRALLAFDLVIGVFALCEEVRDQWARHGGPGGGGARRCPSAAARRRRTSSSATASRGTGCGNGPCTPGGRRPLRPGGRTSGPTGWRRCAGCGRNCTAWRRPGGSPPNGPPPRWPSRWASPTPRTRPPASCCSAAPTWSTTGWD